MSIIVIGWFCIVYSLGERMKEKVIGYLQALCWVRLLLAKVKNSDDPREVLRKLAAEVDSALETITLGAGVDFREDIEAEVKGDVKSA